MIETIRQALRRRRMRVMERSIALHREEAHHHAGMAELHVRAAEVIRETLEELQREHELRDSGLPDVSELDGAHEHHFNHHDMTP